MYPARVGARSSEVASEGAAEVALKERRAIEAVLAGDRRAFRVLVERHQRGVYNVVLRLVHSAADAEDLAQQAFLSAFGALGSFQLEARFAPWLYRIAVNLAKDHLKSRRRGEVPTAEPGEDDALFTATLPATDGAAQSGERRRLLARALSALSFADREVLVLKDIEELPYDDLQQILRRPVTALKIRVVRARARLRVQLLRLVGKDAL
jgi:RNA polymerase sigma-70 factor (ECF subfamily)